MTIVCIKCGFPEENHVPGVRHTFAPREAFPPGTISEHRQGSAYLPEEVRTTSSTGGEKGTKSERYDLIPTAPLASLARLMGKGAEKYDDHNWRKGYEFSKSYSALMRHLQTWWEGRETIDPEMGESHLAAVIFHAMVMMDLEKTHPEHDDRYKPEDDMLAKNMKAFEEFGR